MQRVAGVASQVTARKIPNDATAALVFLVHVGYICGSNKLFMAC